MATNDGGPAFPCDSSQKQYPTQEGMSLRDWFAGQALVGIVGRIPVGSSSASRLVKIAYRYADMLLDERDRKQREVVAREHFASKKESFENCVQWAKANGLKDTRAVKAIGEAGISSFSQINREILEEVRNCGDRTIGLIFAWRNAALAKEVQRD